MNFITSKVEEVGITNMIYSIRQKISYDECMTELNEKLKNRNVHYLLRYDRNGYTQWETGKSYEEFVEELDNFRLIPYYDNVLKFYTKFDVIKFENYTMPDNKKVKVITIDDYNVQKIIDTNKTEYEYMLNLREL